MPVVSALSPLSLTPIFDNDGRLVRGGSVYFYRPDTLDPLTVYQEQELGIPHPHPISIGGSGRFPAVYVGAEPQRVRIFNAGNELVEDINWLPPATTTTGGGGGEVGEGALETGDVIWRFSNGGVRAGFVRLNGGTVGNAASGATERANDDAHDLFVWLWGQDSTGLQLTVLPSRGATAEGDWLANKRLTLPDANNTVLAGIAGMGLEPTTALRKLTGAIFDAGDTDTVGSRGGRATHALTGAENGPHTHGVTDPGHTHTASQAAHNHGVNDPGHAHGVSQTPHAHGIADAGHTHSISQSPHAHGISDPGHAHNFTETSVASGLSGMNGGFQVGTFDQARTTAGSGTGIGIQPQNANITIIGAATGISVNSASANVSVNSAATGITTQNVQPAVTVNSGTAGISVASAGSGTAHNNAMPFLLGTFYMKL